MLKQDEIEAEEERLRNIASSLPDDERKQFYDEVKRELRDPDTYAVLNWFFLVGLHHAYLRRWLRAGLNVAVVIMGGILLADQQWLPGSAMILAVVIMEIWELFRSQLIVQDWNNRIFRSVLCKYTSEWRQG